MKTWGTLDIKDIQKNVDYHIVNAYIVGSQVYETCTKLSDIDMKLVVHGADFDKTKQFNVEIGDKIYDLTLYNYHYFIECLKLNKIDIFEALMVGDIYKFETIRIKYDINPQLLRKSVSSINSNSWVKCKKKLAQGDYKIGLKSLFHSLRVVDFGIQIMTYGKIVKYNSANSIMNRIDYKYSAMNTVGWTWEELDKEFRPTKKKMLTEFKKLAPKV